MSSSFQDRAADRKLRVPHGQTIRRDRLEAVTALARAASDHRTATWRRGGATLTGTGTDRIEAVRSESHMNMTTTLYEIEAGESDDGSTCPAAALPQGHGLHPSFPEVRSGAAQLPDATALDGDM
ncbi:hypothetical protein ACIBRY_03230 [Streptomyces anulatus]